MPASTTQGNLPLLLLQAREALMQRYRPVLLQAGLNEQQWRVLLTLYKSPYSDAASLAQQAQLLAPSLTRMLRTLEQAHLIIRRADPNDLRRQIIHLSTGGYEKVARLMPEIDTLSAQIEQELGAELVSAVIAHNQALIQQLSPDHEHLSTPSAQDS